MQKEKNIMSNPLDKHYTGKFPLKKQEVPGLQSEMQPNPDCGEEEFASLESSYTKTEVYGVTGGDHKA